MTDAAQSGASSAATTSTDFPRYRVGSIEVTTVTDGGRTFPFPDNFVLNASRDEVNAALAAAGMPPNVMTIVFNPVVIETGAQRVLLDTGMGEAAGAAPDASNGLLMRNLRAAGIDPKTIDVVVISHFHGDHVNGLLAADGGLAFPNARITVPEKEWAFWMSDEEMGRAGKGRMEELFHNNRRVFGPMKERIETHAWDKEVAAGMTAVGTPGHTAGHTSYVLSSEGKSVFVQSDVTNHPALFAHNPGWHAFFDQDPAQAEQTRRRVYEMLVAEKMPVQGFHFPLPSLGRVEKDGHGYRIVYQQGV